MLALQSEVTINWPGTHVHHAYGLVVGRRMAEMPDGCLYIVHVPKLKAQLNLSISRLCPLDPPVDWSALDRKMTVSWQRLWQACRWVPSDRRHRITTL